MTNFIFSLPAIRGYFLAIFVGIFYDVVVLRLPAVDFALLGEIKISRHNFSPVIGEKTPEGFTAV